MAEQITEEELIEMRSNFRHTDRIMRLVDAYRAQAAEIERLKARGVTERAIYARADRYATAGGAARDIVRLLKSLDLLIEDAPADQIPEMEVKSGEIDPLKVEMSDFEKVYKGQGLHSDAILELREKHNALVDALRLGAVG